MLVRSIKNKVSELKNLSKVVTTKKPKHDGVGGGEAKARICCCGNYEEGTYGHADNSRAEVPSTYELRTIFGVSSKG